MSKLISKRASRSRSRQEMEAYETQTDENGKKYNIGCACDDHDDELTLWICCTEKDCDMWYCEDQVQELTGASKDDLKILRTDDTLFKCALHGLELLEFKNEEEDQDKTKSPYNFRKRTKKQLGLGLGFAQEHEQDNDDDERDNDQNDVRDIDEDDERDIDEDEQDNDDEIMDLSRAALSEYKKPAPKPKKPTRKKKKAKKPTRKNKKTKSKKKKGPTARGICIFILFLFYKKKYLFLFYKNNCSIWYIQSKWIW